VRISVVHSTVYRYEAPVYLEPHVVRLRPRDDGAQHLLSYSLQIAPLPAGTNSLLDQDGTLAVQAWFTAETSQLAVNSMFEVETLRENPFDFLLRPGAASLPPEHPPALQPYLVDAAPSVEVREYAAAIAAQTSGRTMDFLTALNARLFDETRHVVRDEGAANAPEITLREREGSCRDLAVLFCATCRAVGIPARFVSGYDCGAASEEQDAYMHAWAEVYLEGGGWRGFDPARGLAVSTGHVAVAAAADPALAAPIAGTYRGLAKAHMQFSIAIRGAGL
jgi:transglutaminase-like putative cysteine protease